MAYSYDPELADAVTLLPSVDIKDVTAARASLAAEPSVTLDESSLNVENHVIPGHKGDSAVTVRVYRPLRISGAVPALLYIHGGGFVVGSIESEQGTPHHLR